MPGPTVHADPEQWARVAERIKRRRLELGLSQDEMGASRSVASNLEAGRQVKYSETSLWKVCHALNWTPDSIERILRGDEPHLAKPEGPPLAESDVLAEVARLRARIEQIEARLASEQPADDGPGTSRSA